MIALALLLAAPTSSIAYVFHGDIWTCDQDGKHQTRVIRNGGEPAWSPDHRRLCFVRDNRLIVVYDFATKKEKVIWTSHEAETKVGAPSWGPTYAISRWDSEKPAPTNGGDSILFQPNYFMPPVMQCTSTGKRLGEAPINIPVATASQSPTWSRDGKCLALAVNGDVWINFNEGGGWAARRLVACADYDFATGRGDMYIVYARHFSWSPDGRRLAYTRERVSGSGTNELWIASIKNDKNGPELVETKKISDSVASVSFTPDGKKLVGETVGSYSGIAIYDSQSDQWRILVREASEPAA